MKFYFIFGPPVRQEEICLKESLKLETHLDVKSKRTYVEITEDEYFTISLVWPGRFSATANGSVFVNILPMYNLMDEMLIYVEAVNHIAGIRNV